MKRSILKKMIVLTLAFAMVFSSVITSVSANEAELTGVLTATADKESYLAGDTAVVTLAATGEVDSIGLTYGYDAGLTFVSAEWTAADAQIVDVDLEKGKAVIAFDGAVVLTETDVFVLTFTVDAEAADGEYNVTVTPVMKNGAANVAADTAVATVVVGNAHECVFGDWQSNETSHWKACECGEVVGLEDHAYANNCDDTCDTCGYVRTVGDHEWGDWIIDTAATETAAGSKHRECSCGETETKVIPIIMKFASATLTFESSITINFKVKPEYFNNYGYTDHYVVFTFEDDYGVPYDTVVTEYRIENPGSSSERYVYEFNGVKSFQMTTPVTATLYATHEGEIYGGKPQPYSVQQYCSNQLAKSTNAEFKGLLVHFLDYGTAAQEEWDIRLDNLANSVVTDAHRAFCNAEVRDYTSITNTKFKDIDNELVVWKSATLLFQDAIVIRLRLAADDMSGITCKVTTDDGREWIIDNEDITWNDSAARYEIHFDGLYAFDLSTAVYFTMMKDGVEVSDTLSYSVESYVAGKITGSQAALLKAMMMYGDSAAIYFK